MRSATAPAARHFDLARFPSLAEALADATFRYRSNACLIETDRGRVEQELSYSDFLDEAARCAQALREAGVQPGARVALLMANGPRWLIGAYAVIQLGGVLVPLDSRLDAEGQAALLAHCGARVLLCDGPTWRRLRPLLAGDLSFVLVSRPLDALEASYARDWSELPELLEGAPALEPSGERGRDDVAAIVYSSGTSGRPKGCRMSHGNYLTQLQALANAFPLEEDDVYLSVLPTNHAIDFMCGFLVPLLCGARVVHLRTLRPEWITGALADQRVTHFAAVPALLTALERGLRERLDGLERLPAAGLAGFRRLNAWLTERRPRPRLSRALLRPIHQALGGRLKTIFAGGAPVPPGTARFLYELGVPVAIGYGLSEACAVVTVNRLDPFRADTVGRPLEGVEVRLEGRDAEGRGEVWVRGPNVFLGYLDDEELTRETFSEGWLKTGDLGVIDATGHLRLVGRRKHMIVTSGGKNVYPEDVEQRLGDLPCEEFAVVARHRVWAAEPGEAEELLLIVRPRKEAPDAADATSALLELARKRNRRLPAYLRLSGALVVSKAFPRTTSLKLKRADLVKALAGFSPRDLTRLS